MVLEVTKLLAIIITLTATSVSLSQGYVLSQTTFGDREVEEFDLFWSARTHFIREKCDDPPGNYKKLLLAAINSNSDCHNVTNRWNSLHRQQMIKYPNNFQRYCGHIVESAARCWNHILMFMEMCHPIYNELDWARVMLFPNFLGSICLQNSTTIFPDLSVKDPNCVDQIEYELKKFATPTDLQQLGESQSRADGCRFVKAYFQCSYLSTDTPSELFHIYIRADEEMDKVFVCDEIASYVATNLREIDTNSPWWRYG